ncbi:MAG: hypothetical protein ACK401_07845 [Archaeoglobaceae archaeon]
MKKILTIAIVVSFCLCLGYPKVVYLSDLDKISVLKISEDVGDSNFTIIFSVENKLGDLQIDENSSDLGIYRGGIKIGEAIYYDKELKSGLNDLTVKLSLNSTSLEELWRAHLSEGETSELVIRAYLVYDLGGSFLRIFHTKSENVSTNLLPEINGSSCNLSFNLSSKWGDIGGNDIEVVHSLEIVSESEETVSLNISVYLNDVLISESKKEVKINPETNEILISQSLPISKLSKLLKLRNVFSWKIKLEIPRECFGSFEDTESFNLVVG